jgi:signal transduction histidine kinase
MKKEWKKLSDTYKILISMLLFIMFIQLSTLVYIWKYESKVLLEKERKNLSYQLDMSAKLLLNHMKSLEKELTFLSTLEVMDDIVVKDIDKRITILLEKKSKDLSEGIVLLAMKGKERIASSHKEYDVNDFFKFQVDIDASFDKNKTIGSLLLLYPYQHLENLKSSNPYQYLWLESFMKKESFVPTPQDNVIVSKSLDGIFHGAKLSLAYNKSHALKSIREIEQILIFAFILSLFSLLFVVWVLSKKQIEILEHTQEVLALKRTFLSTMSHELRTPLGSILNLTQHLMVSSKVGDDEVDMLIRIENSSEHLLEMINNLLQLSKLESNSMQVNRESIELMTVVEEIIEMVEPLIEEKELCLKKNMLFDHVMLVTDLHLFKQVVINLLSNAIKFTEKGSIEISLYRKENSFVFEVLDTGIGIEKEKQKALFSEFYQAHTKEVQHSSGLGLALSQKVAKLINGEIKIVSDGREKGTRATFSFKSI